MSTFVKKKNMKKMSPMFLTQQFIYKLKVIYIFTNIIKTYDYFIKVINNTRRW